MFHPCPRRTCMVKRFLKSVLYISEEGQQRLCKTSSASLRQIRPWLWCDCIHLRLQKTRQKPLNKTKKSTDVLASGGSNYTIVQTVFRLGSNRTALPSTDFALVLYMGFSKAACPLLFSWTEQPVYWVFGVVLSDETQHQNVIRIQSPTALRVHTQASNDDLAFNNLQNQLILSLQTISVTIYFFPSCNK